MKKMAMSMFLDEDYGINSTTQTILVATAAFGAVYAFSNRKTNLPPGPLSFPLIGNSLSFLSKNFSEVINDWQKKYGPIFTFYFGSGRMVVINDIDILTEAFVKNGSAASGRPFVHSMDIATYGSKDIVMANYSDTLKFQRKVAGAAVRQFLMGSALEQRVYEVLQPVINAMLEEKEAFDPHHYISLSIFNVIIGICFGDILKMDDPQFLELIQAFDDFNDAAGSGLVEDFFPPLRMMPSQNYKTFMKSYTDIIKWVKKHFDEHKTNYDEQNLIDFTDHMLFAKDEAEKESSEKAGMLDDEHAIQIITDVFGAGVDTTRTQLDWLFFFLAARQDIQEKLHQQIDEVIGDRVPGKEHRSKLPYVEAVMLECMRMYPVAPLGVPHETMVDCKVAGYNIPKGTTILANQNAILHDPKHWENPFEFIPERFLSPDGTKVQLRQASWIPFSLGQRVCLGESLAKLEMVYTICGLLQRLHFSLPPDHGEPDLSCKLEGFLNRPNHYKLIVTAR